MREKCEIMRAKKPLCSGREVGDKCDIMGTKALRASTSTRRSSCPSSVVQFDRHVLRTVLGSDVADASTSAANRHRHWTPQYWAKQPAYLKDIPECTGRQVGGKPEIMRAENAECGRQVGDKCKIMRAEKPVCSGREVGDKWDAGAKACRPKHSEHPGCSGRQVGDKQRQVGDKPEIKRAESSVVGDTHSIQSVLGDK